MQTLSKFEEVGVSKLEVALIDWFMKNLKHEAIVLQLRKLKVIKREYTGVGYYFQFALPGEKESIKKVENVRSPINGPRIHTKALINLGEAIMFIRNGFIDFIEVYSLSGNFPKVLEDFILEALPYSGDILKNEKKRILIFSVEVGLAHITRSLAIAEELKKRGHEVLFPIILTKQTLLKQSGIATQSLLEFLPTENLAQNIERLKNPTVVNQLVQEELTIINRFKPDLALVDLRFSAALAAAIADIPTVFLTGSGGLPFGCLLPNGGYPKWLHRFIEPALSFFIWKTKRAYLKTLVAVASDFDKHISLEQMVNNMQYIVPEIPGYLPPKNIKITIHYTGPIFWNGFNNYQPDWMNQIQPTGKAVYITFGGTGFDGNKLVELSKKLTQSGYTVVVSASNIAQLSEFPKNTNLFVAKYLPGEEICKKVDLVICHGGYGTMIQAILQGKPVIAIPFNPDQLLHALRFQELGLGKCLVKFTPKLLTHFNWNTFEELGRAVPIDAIVKTVGDVLKEKETYIKQINQYKAKISPQGHVVAANVIEKMLN